MTMKILVGLGNPGESYHFTRHNIGFLFLDYLIMCNKEDLISYVIERKLQAELAQIALFGQTCLLVKPQTYMNTSGSAVKRVVEYYKQKVTPSLLVIHDDLDIAFGDWKLSFAKGPKVHNGLNSICEQLKTDQFWRLRLGIAGEQYRDIKRQGKSVAEEYILRPFSQEEQQRLPELFLSAQQGSREYLQLL